MKQRHFLSQERKSTFSLTTRETSSYGFMLCLPYYDIKSMGSESVLFPWLPRGLTTALGIEKLEKGMEGYRRRTRQRENHVDGRGSPFLCRLTYRHPEGAAEIRANVRGLGCLWSLGRTKPQGRVQAGAGRGPSAGRKLHCTRARCSAGGGQRPGEGHGAGALKAASRRTGSPARPPRRPSLTPGCSHHSRRYALPFSTSALSFPSSPFTEQPDHWRETLT